MSDSSSNAIGTKGNTYPGPVLTNVDNTIAGAGIIGITYYSSDGYSYYYYGGNLTLNNKAKGVIDATGTNNQLKIYGSVTNAGLIEATGAAGLWLAAYVNNTGGIIAAGANSVVDLVATITGGTLQGSGSFIVPDGSSAGLAGAITDNATIALQSTGDVTTLVMTATSKIVNGSYTLVNPTLTGGGNIILSGPSSEIIGQGYNPVTFANAGVTISGGGTIGGGNLTLNNKAKGVIDANSYYPLIIDTGTNTVTNAGTLKADFGGELFIASNLSNTGALYANNGTILIAGAVTGSGSALINGTGDVEFGAASSNGTKFAAGSTGDLVLDDSKHYTGTISGFGTNTTQSIDLTDIQFATATESYANGTLTIKDGLGDAAHIKFSGTHMLASFNSQDDGQGGVLITDPPVSSKTQIGNVALFANYIASMFASASLGHGAIPTSWMDAPLPQLLSLPHA